MVIENIHVYGIENAVRGSKFPMSVDVDSLNSEITKTTKKLGSVDAGTGHDQFLSGIIVQFDLRFTIKAWVEAERYTWLDFISSQSTMHRISKMNIEDNCIKYVTQNTINEVNRLKDIYLKTKDPEDYLTLLYNVPTGFQLTAAMTTNYRQLKIIYNQRKSHRLPEWHEFCEQIEKLPYFKELVLGEENE